MVDARRGQDLADRHHGEVGAARGDHAARARAARRHRDGEPVRETESRKQIVLEPDAAGAAGHGDQFGFQQNLLEGVDAAHVGSRGPRTHRDAEGHLREIDVGSGGDPVRGDQLGKAFPRHDHHVGVHAASELSRDRVRPGSLRRARPGRDRDAARPLEFRQQRLVGAGEPAGDQDAHARRGGGHRRFLGLTRCRIAGRTVYQG